MTKKEKEERKEQLKKQIEKLTGFSIVSACQKINVDPSNIYRGNASIETFTDVRNMLVDDILEALNEVEYYEAEIL